MMRRPDATLAVAAAMGLLAALGDACGQTSMDGAFATAFSAALSKDPDYRAARYELAAREASLEGARAGLLPALNVTLSDSYVRGDSTAPNVPGQDFTRSLNYRTPSVQLQLRAPLFNLEAWQRYKSVGATVQAGRMQFISRGHDLLERLGTNWLQVLHAEDQRGLQRAQVEALQAQLDSAKRRFESGEGTRTEVLAASAGLSLGRAQMTEAADRCEQALRALARITGDEALALRGLPAEPIELALPQGEVQVWLDQAMGNNAQLAARRAQLEAARTEVLRARAGHAPRLDLVANASDSRNESISTLNQRNRLYGAGLQLTIPIYSGGSVSAGVSQAAAEASRIEAQLESERAQLELDLRRQFQALQTGRAKIQALSEAVLASGVALEDAQRNVTAGYKTPADVLDAVRRLFQSRRDLMQARYEILLARLRLQALAGIPVTEIVIDLDRQLDGPIVGSPLAETSR